MNLPAITTLYLVMHLSMIIFQVGTENYEFFPMNRALCLSSIDIDSTESKIDDLLSRVTSIAMKQKEEVELSFLFTYIFFDNTSQ